MSHTVKETKEALDLFERVLKVIKSKSTDQMAQKMKDNDDKYTSASKSYRDGFQDGLNIGLSYWIDGVEELDINEVLKAIYENTRTN